MIFRGSEIQKIVSSSKSCSFGLECRLEQRSILILKTIPGTVRITFRRCSGNGRVVISNQSEQQTITVHSKTQQSFEIITQDGSVTLKRGVESIGDVTILEIETGDELSNRWKSIVGKIGPYRSLKAVGDQLFAGPGAVIENDSVVESITTQPPNMWKREGGEIHFTQSCEILDIVVSGQGQPTVKLSFPTHTSAPSVHPAPIIQPIPLQVHKISFPVQDKMQTTTVPYNATIYDSQQTRFPPSTNQSAQVIKSNGAEFIVLKRGKLFSIPLASLGGERNYTVVVTSKRLNGNGRFHLGLHTSYQPDNFITVMSDGLVSEKYISIRTPQIKNASDIIKLTVQMKDDGAGEILISRLVVYEQLTETQHRQLESQRYYTSNQPINDLVLESKKRFCIVIPSYNNIKWFEKNIQSTLEQQYENYRVIFTDDCSSDGTFEAVEAMVKRSNRADRFTLIKNTIRSGALKNLYTMIHSCDDDEIILTLDGDDWLSGPTVLSRLNQIYSTEDVWMTYGQYQNYPDGGMGISTQIPPNVIQNRSFRSYRWCSSHLRTFYSWLFKLIREEDFKYKNEFMSMAWDMTIMYPMLELSSNRSRFISDILYRYNLENPINDHKVNVKLQQELDRYVRHLPPYQPITEPIARKTNRVGLMMIATGRYHQYVQQMISSADSYFLPDDPVTYYVFTDTEQTITSTRKVVQIQIQHRPFPFASMDRFRHFTNAAETLSKEEYLYYVDVDCSWVDYVGREIVGDLVGVAHCGFFGGKGPVENNPASRLYLDPSRYSYYFGGGFSGGRAGEYLKLSRWCSEAIDRDVANNIIPLWHDETALNRYFVDHEPNVILSPSYHYPQSNPTHYKTIWKDRKFKPKLLLLDKNHAQMRSDI